MYDMYTQQPVKVEHMLEKSRSCGRPDELF